MPERLPERGINLNRLKLCLNCDNIVTERPCPVCSSGYQIFISKFIGNMREDLKRFIIQKDGKVELMKISSDQKEVRLDE